MVDDRNVQESKSTDREMAWHTVVALALGLLLGVLVSMPYEQVMGPAAVVVTPMKYLASLVILTSLTNGYPAEVVSAVRSGREQTGRRFALPKGLFPAPGSRKRFEPAGVFAAGSLEPQVSSGAS